MPKELYSTVTDFIPSRELMSKISLLYNSFFVAIFASFLCGCGSSVSVVSNPPTDSLTNAATGTARDIYVTQAGLIGAASVLRFSALSDGNLQPTSSFSVPSVLRSTQSVAVDQHGLIYVGGRDNNTVTTILVFSAGAMGSPSPIRTLILTPTTYKNVGAMTFDVEGNLYAGCDDEVAVFAANGGSSPIRIIQGPATQMSFINGIAVDLQFQIYVTNGMSGAGSVLVFAPSASGTIPPVRSIVAVQNSILYDPSGIATDASGNLYVSGYLTPATTIAGSASIFEFAPGASGSAMPIKTIAGSATGLAGVGSIRTDATANLYTLIVTASTAVGGKVTYTPSVATFSPSANSNVAPLRSFTSPDWSSPAYGQLGLD